MLSWFDTRGAKAAGVALAGSLALHNLEKAALAKQQQRTIQTLLQRADKDVRPLGLNFLQRASFANAFKWALLEKGLDRQTTDQLTHAVVSHLFMRPGR
jgi:hypothetical protein